MDKLLIGGLILGVACLITGCQGTFSNLKANTQSVACTGSLASGFGKTLGIIPGDIPVKSSLHR